MIYNYKCTGKKCGHIQEGEASFKDFKDIHPKCEKCKKLCNYIFIASQVQFILKDGPSGSWPSKGNHFKNYRQKKYEEMGRRQRDRYGDIKRDAIPNYGGQLTGDWQEAQFQAMKDKGPEVAATFNEKVKKERSKSKKIVV